MSEPRFTTLTPESMTAAQKRVADAIQSGPRGAGLRGPFNALLQSPELCDLVQRVGAYVRFGTSIPQRLNEMAIIMAGRKWTAQYEFYAHRRLALEAGLTPAIADAIAANQRPEGMAKDEETVYDFVSELLATGEVPDAAFQRVKERLRRTRRRRSRRRGRLLQPGIDDAECRTGTAARGSDAAAEVRRYRFTRIRFGAVVGRESVSLCMVRVAPLRSPASDAAPHEPIPGRSQGKRKRLATPAAANPCRPWLRGAGFELAIFGYDKCPSRQRSHSSLVLPVPGGCRRSTSIA
jgi:4-carboxymuconolactone decarboxylase